MVTYYHDAIYAFSTQHHTCNHPSSLIIAVNRWLQPEGHGSLAGRDTCDGFAGNSELYGLRIRIGVYLQWISSLLTNVFVPTGLFNSLDTNSIFLFALFIAIANATSACGGLLPAEAFIMLQMCFGYLLSVLSVSGLRVTLLNDPHRLRPDLWLAKLQKSGEFVTAMSTNPGRFNGLFKTSFQGPPESVKIPRFQLMLLQIPDIWAVYSVVSGWVMSVSLTLPSGHSSQSFG